MSGIILLVLRVAMTVALYSFLGWTLLLMWRTLKQEAFLLSARETVPISLQMDGPDTTARLLHFRAGDVLVGRDPDCECAILDETVSARHVRFTYHHGHWWVEDLGSRNGTGLNGEPLTTATIVVNGDLVKCGQSSLRVILDTQPSREYQPTHPTENKI